MHLILLSKHFIKKAQKHLNRLTGKDNSKIKLAFCTNASDMEMDKNKKYIEESRNELSDSGYRLIELDLNNNIKRILITLKGVDAVFFSGGNLFYLLHLFNKSQLSLKYKMLLNKGLIHIGFSAGAMICSKELKGYELFVENDVEIQEGLGLFPYYIVAHYFDKPKYTEAYNKCIDKGFTNTIPLSNDEAIIVEDQKWEKIK